MQNDTTPYPENEFFMDDVAVITKMLQDGWSLGPENTPVISYEMEGMMVDARASYVFVYHVSRYNSVSSTDYLTLQRTSFVDIRVSSRSRKNRNRGSGGQSRPEPLFMLPGGEKT